ncbi:11450_t:CDS:2 [Paraglomus brasilianum]|uniref:proteasome endopeptidase complex n=1 Tax=Paraglomus brasilianum TaxID=144538 RepID=A0A9N9G9X3_9GLOM|nr:11450_t:CDS:2 [Paraglomus brasilianum]
MVSRVDVPKGGFNFDNYQRNLILQEKGFSLPKPTKTGTTIVGTKFKNGVVLGADTRATGDTTVMDKNCFKIHYLAPNIYGCGAGTAADTDKITKMVASQLELHRLATGRESRVATALTALTQFLFRYQGHLGAALVLGGVDVDGPHLFSVSPHGSTDKLPYLCQGSGSLAAISIFESQWRENMERDEAIELVKEAIKAGIFNDMGSGSSVDVAVIEKGRAEVCRGMEVPYPTIQKVDSYKFKPGTTAILSESFRNFVTITEGDAMDIS